MAVGKQAFLMYFGPLGTLVGKTHDGQFRRQEQDRHRDANALNKEGKRSSRFLSKALIFMFKRYLNQSSRWRKRAAEWPADKQDGNEAERGRVGHWVLDKYPTGKVKVSVMDKLIGRNRLRREEKTTLHPITLIMANAETEAVSAAVFRSLINNQF